MNQKELSDKFIKSMFEKVNETIKKQAEYLATLASNEMVKWVHDNVSSRFQPAFFILMIDSSSNPVFKELFDVLTNKFNELDREEFKLFLEGSLTDDSFLPED